MPIFQADPTYYGLGQTNAGVSLQQMFEQSGTWYGPEYDPQMPMPALPGEVETELAYVTPADAYAAAEQGGPMQQMMADQIQLSDGTPVTFNEVSALHNYGATLSADAVAGMNLADAIAWQQQQQQQQQQQLQLPPGICPMPMCAPCPPVNACVMPSGAPPTAPPISVTPTTRVTPGAPTGRGAFYGEPEPVHYSPPIQQLPAQPAQRPDNGGATGMLVLLGVLAAVVVTS